MALTLMLPWPNPKLAPNRSAGRHWRATRALKDAARDEAFLLARRNLARNPRVIAAGEKVPLKLTFCAPNCVRRDLDGLLSASKHALDGIAMALGIDDAQFEPLTLTRGATGRPGWLIVEIGC